MAERRLQDADEERDGDYIAIVDATITLGRNRRGLLRRFTGSEVAALRYEPARGGWLLPAELIDALAGRG